MSNVPAAARRQIKEANRLFDQQKGVAPPPQALSPIPGAQPQPQQIHLQPVPDFPNVGAQPGAGFVPQASQNQPATSLNAPPVQQAPHSAAEPPPGAQPVGDNWEQKYKVIEGKYRAEQRRSREQIGQLQHTVNTLAAQRATPAPQPAPPAAPQTPEERAVSAGLTKKELEEYGPELVDMIMRVATNLTAPQIRALANEQQRLAGVVNTSAQGFQRSAREMLYEHLVDKVPDWEDVNKSDEFLDWLNEVDLFSGFSRKAGLMQAFEQNDAQRVTQMFKAFKAEDERARSTARTPLVDPVTLIAPGQPASGSSAPAPAGNGGELIHEQEIGDFFNAVRMGKIKGEAKKVREAQINLAIAQGRVIPTHSDRHIQNSR